MAEVTVPAPVNIGHVSTLLGGIPVHALGPYDDGTVRVDADVAEDELRQALDDHDPSWTAPRPPQPADPFAQARAHAARVPVGPIREALSAVIEAAARR